MSFDLKDAEQVTTNTDSTKNNYQKPGIYEAIRVTDVVYDKTKGTQTPYLLLKTIGQNGEVGQSSFMWLTTTPKEGKTTTGWMLTARNLVDIICATNNISRADAEAIELVPSDIADKDTQCKALSQKVASLIVGKPLRIKFKGEQNRAEGIIFASLDRVESMQIPRASSSLRFDETKDIKLFVSPVVTTTDTASPF